jgi:hypothetical protein
VADLGVHPGRGNDHLAAPARHGRVHIGHAGPVAERYVALDRLGSLGHWQTFSGEGGLFYLEGRGNTNPAVRGNPIAGLHQHHVPRHELFGVDLEGLTIPSNPRDSLEHLRQRLDAFLRLGLLAQTDHRVEDREAGKDCGGRHVSRDDKVDHGGREQDDLHEVPVLSQERLKPRLPLRTGKSVGAVGLEAAARLADAEPTLEIDAELLGNRGCLRLVPAGSWDDVTFRLLAHLHGLSSTCLTDMPANAAVRTSPVTGRRGDGMAVPGTRTSPHAGDYPDPPTGPYRARMTPGGLGDEATHPHRVIHWWMSVM